MDHPPLLNPPSLITARSKREAMDWGLVLLSQGLQGTIVSIGDQWALAVDLAEFNRASTILQQWRSENKGWHWRRRLPGSKFQFHWGSLFFALAIGAFHYKAAVVKQLGVMDIKAVTGGEWWRLFTAVTLHADLPHLISNATMGWLLFGFAMIRYGSGVALLAGFLAGAIGNVMGLMFYSDYHQSLGASGMVMGALGLLASESFGFWRKARPSRDIILRALAAGILILVLMGFSPGTDVVAHVGGFFGGAFLGFALSWVPPQKLRGSAVNVMAVAILIGIVALTWGLSLRAP